MTGIIGDKAIKLPASSGDLASSEREHGNVMVRHNSTSGKPEFSTNGTNWTQFGTGTGGVFPVAKPETPVAGSIFYQKSDNKLKIYDGTNWYSQADAFAVDASLNSGGGQQPTMPDRSITKTSTGNQINNSDNTTSGNPNNRWIGISVGFQTTGQGLALAGANASVALDGAEGTTGNDRYLDVAGVRIWGVRFTRTLNRIRIGFSKPDAGSKTLKFTLTKESDTTKEITFQASFDQQSVVTLPAHGGSTPTAFFKDITISSANLTAGTVAEALDIFGGTNGYVKTRDTVKLVVTDNVS